MKLGGRKRRNGGRNSQPAGGRPKVYSYSSLRSAQDRPLNRGEEKPSSQAGESRKVSRIINILILLFILGSAAYLSVLEPNAQVKISGEKIYPREKSSYEAKVNEFMGQSVLNRNKLTFNEAKLAARIKQEFPEVNTIKVGAPLMRHRPVVEVTLAKPAARLVTKDKIYILDSEGRALFEESQASAALDTDGLMTINDASGHDISLGRPALTQAQIGFINEVIGQTSAKGLKPQSFALSEGGTAVDVRFEDIGYFVKFSFYSEPRQSSGAFLALYEQISASGPVPQQYVDLRIPDKAFIR